MFLIRSKISVQVNVEGRRYGAWAWGQVLSQTEVG